MSGLGAQVKEVDIMQTLSEIADDLLPRTAEERKLILGIHEYGLEEEHVINLIKALRKTKRLYETIRGVDSFTASEHIMPFRQDVGLINVLANIEKYLNKLMLLDFESPAIELCELAKKISSWESEHPDQPVNEICKDIRNLYYFDDVPLISTLAELLTPDFTRAIIARSYSCSSDKNPIVKACSKFELNTLMERDDKVQAGKMLTKLRQVFSGTYLSVLMQYVINADGEELEMVLDKLGLNSESPKVYEHLGPLITAINPNMAPFSEHPHLPVSYVPEIALEVDNMEDLLDIPVEMICEAFDYAIRLGDLLDLKQNLIKAVNEGCGSEYIHSLLSSIRDPSAFGGGHYERLACQ